MDMKAPPQGAIVGAILRGSEDPSFRMEPTRSRPQDRLIVFSAARFGRARPRLLRLGLMRNPSSSIRHGAFLSYFSLTYLAPVLVSLS